MTLAQLRRKKKISQTELGKLVFEKLGRKSEGIYPQKKVSLWEQGGATPNHEEIRALSFTLSVSQDEILRSLPQRKVPNRDTIDIFRGLAESGHDAIAMICFSGPPGGPYNKKLFEVIRNGLSNKMCVAMVVPFPIKRDSSPEVVYDSVSELGVYYASVLNEVMKYRDQLREGMEKDKSQNAAVFAPVDCSDILMPPFFSRYYVTVEFIDNIERVELYFWVETAEINESQEVATSISPPALVRTLINPWTAYFYEILSVWKQHRNLSQEAFSKVEPRTWKLL